MLFYSTFDYCSTLDGLLSLHLAAQFTKGVFVTHTQFLRSLGHHAAVALSFRATYEPSMPYSCTGLRLAHNYFA